MKNYSGKCPICGAESVQSYLESHVDSGINYDLYECEKCKVQHWSPMSNPGGEWYERDTRYANRNIDPTIIPGIQHILAMKTISKYPGKIFDIGCGNGNFLAYAKSFGFDGVGIDFDRDGIESGKKTFGLNDLYVSDLQKYVLENPDKKYEWSVFFDVFEHVDNHNEFIELVKQTLKPGGRIAMSIPNRNGSRWILTSDFPPRHLTRWNGTVIKNYLESKGFEEVIVGMYKAPFHQIILKIKWKYGKVFSFGLVKKAKEKTATAVYTNEQGRETYIPKITPKIKLIHFLAKLKDYVLFGIPAIFIYLYLWLAGRIYTDLVITAKIKN